MYTVFYKHNFNLFLYCNKNKIEQSILLEIKINYKSHEKQIP